jgi:hypothetical protein
VQEKYLPGTRRFGVNNQFAVFIELRHQSILNLDITHGNVDDVTEVIVECGEIVVFDVIRVNLNIELGQPPGLCIKIKGRSGDPRDRGQCAAIARCGEEALWFRFAFDDHAGDFFMTIADGVRFKF